MHTIILIAIYIFANGVSTNDNTIVIVNNSIAEDYGLSSGDKIVAVKDIVVKSGTTEIYSDCTDASQRCEIVYFSGFNTYLNNELLLALEKKNYNSKTYKYGYVINMPFENTVNKENL